MAESDNLRDHEKDILINHFFHYLESDGRRRLMREFPLIYNKAVGQEVMIVARKCDAEQPD